MRLILIALLISSCVSHPKAPVKQPYLQTEYQAPQPPPEPEFGIVLVGDTGTGERDQYAVAKGMEAYCQKNKCSTGLLLGDNFYPMGVKDILDPQFKTKFEDVYKNLKFTFYVAVGNHDRYGNKEAETKYKSAHWESGGLYYSVDAHWIDFFCIDTNGNGFEAPFKGKPQRLWLKEMLAKSTARWKIVFGHHPVYSSGVHGNSIMLGHYIKPMLQEGAVDFYISGHDHDKELIERDGTKFIVSGAGSKTRSVGKGKNTIFSKSSLGFAHLLLSKDRAVIRFIDVDGNVEFERAYMKPMKDGGK